MKRALKTLLVLALLSSLPGCRQPSPGPEDKYAVSLEGMYNLEAHYLRESLPRIEDSAVTEKLHTALLKEDVEVSVNIHDEKAPTVIFITGIFGGTESPEMHWLGRKLFA